MSRAQFTLLWVSLAIWASAFAEMRDTFTVELVEGSDAILHCNSSISTTFRLDVFWRKSGQRIASKLANSETSYSDFWLPYVSFVDDYSLKIKNVSFARDNGMFICSSSLFQNSYNVTVVAPVRIVSIMNSSRVALGNELHLSEVTENRITCSGYGHPCPIYSWTLPPGLKATVVSQNCSVSEIVFSATRNMDGKEMSCSASNNEKYMAEKSFELTVTYAPQIQLMQLVPSSPVVEGSDVSFHCDSDGKPTPLYKWMSESDVIASQSNISISNVTRQHAGKYQCTASNKEGSASKDVELAVLYPPGVLLSHGHGLLICSANGLPAIYTFRIWQESGEGDRKLLTEELNATKSAHSCPVNGTGVYICSVSNGIEGTQETRIVIGDTSPVPVPKYPFYMWVLCGIIGLLMLILVIVLISWKVKSIKDGSPYSLDSHRRTVGGVTIDGDFDRTSFSGVFISEYEEIFEDLMDEDGYSKMQSLQTETVYESLRGRSDSVSGNMPSRRCCFP